VAPPRTDRRSLTLCTTPCSCCFVKSAAKIATAITDPFTHPVATMRPARVLPARSMRRDSDSASRRCLTCALRRSRLPAVRSTSLE
jgi:hypothetical protein